MILLMSGMVLALLISGAVILTGIAVTLHILGGREDRYKRKLNEYEKNKDFINAIIEAKKLVALRPRNADYPLRLAELYERSKAFDSAKRVYQTMLKHNILSSKVSRSVIMERLGLIDLSVNKIRDAFIVFKKLHQENPRYIPVLIHLGRIYASQKDQISALKLFQEAHKHMPDHADCHYYWGLTLLDAGEQTDGIVHLEKAYRLMPQNQKVRFFLAAAYRLIGKTTEANTLAQSLNLPSNYEWPSIIKNVGIMSQNVPRIDLSELEKEIAADEERTETKNKARDIDGFLKLSIPEFHAEAKNIISKLGYCIQQEIKDRLSDPNVFAEYIVVSKKDAEKKESAEKIFVQVNRMQGQIGKIPFQDFLHKIQNLHARGGLLVSTSDFGEDVKNQAAAHAVQLYGGASLESILRRR